MERSAMGRPHSVRWVTSQQLDPAAKPRRPRARRVQVVFALELGNDYWLRMVAGLSGLHAAWRRADTALPGRRRG
jgi:hypothetical protein